MNLGLAIIAITALGGVSNWINWRYLNYRIVHWLYYLGAFVHETSHAILCLLTGARITEYNIFSSEPHVTHTRSKLPVVGSILISLAPIAGGLVFLFLINRYALAGYFTLPTFVGWNALIPEVLTLFKEINLLQWQSWVMLLLFLNLGAMLGPSFADLKNIWPALVLLLFVSVSNTYVTGIIFLAITLIVINIILQLVLMAGRSFFGIFKT